MPIAVRLAHFGEVVEYYDGGEENKKDERCLVDAFLPVDTDVASHESLDGKQQDHATVEYRNRKQIQYAEIDADQAHEPKQWRPAGLSGHLAGDLGDAHRA